MAMPAIPKKYANRRGTLVRSFLRPSIIILGREMPVVPELVIDGSAPNLATITHTNAPMMQSTKAIIDIIIAIFLPPFFCKKYLFCS
jgi:hypothetical protein